MNWIFFLVLATVFSCKRSPSESSAADISYRRKRLRVSKSEKRHTLDLVESNRLREFNQLPIIQTFGSWKTAGLKRRCILATIKNQNAEFLNRMFDFCFDMDWEILESVIRTGNCDLFLVLLNRRKTSTMKIITEKYEEAVPCILQSLPLASRHFIQFNSSKRVAKCALKWAIELELIEVLCDIFLTMTHELKRKYLLKGLLLSKHSRKRISMIWILAMLGNLSEAEHKNFSDDNIIKLFQLVENHKLDELDSIKKRNFDVEIFIELDMILKSSIWFGNIELLGEIVRIMPRWFYEFRLMRILELSKYRNSLQYFVPVCREQIPEFLSYHHLESLLSRTIEIGDYSSVKNIIEAMPKSWRKNFNFRNSSRSKIKVILKQIKCIEERQYNKAIVFMEQHRFSLAIKFALIDMIFNPATDYFYDLATNALK